MDKIHEINKKYIKSDIPDFNSGDTVAVDVKVREGNKERVQRFEGIVIARHRKNGLDGTFTVRKITNGIGVERIFPIQSPLIESINVTRRGKVRRSKLNYLKKVKVDTFVCRMDDFGVLPELRKLAKR